jgi:hypothetical protein
MKGSRPKDRLLLWAFLIILVAFGILVARKYLATTPETPLPPPQGQQEQKQLREVILYFGAPDGTHLVPEAREIEDCLDETECIEGTVQALVNGPVGDLVPILPSHTVVRGVTVEDTTAVVDFSSDLISGHPGGSLSELLTVYGLADTLAADFPHIRQVRILVDGQAVDTLKGHMDLRQPISADFSFTHPPEGAPQEGGRPPADGAQPPSSNPPGGSGNG